MTLSGEHEMLLKRWLSLGQRLSLRGDVAGAGRDLLARYSEPHRRYHNCDHLADCLKVFDLHGSEADDPMAVEAALWFHDVVYRIGAADNESRSADLARTTLGSLGLRQARLEFVSEAIVATMHRTVPEPGDVSLVCDIDLSVLGSRGKRYRSYADAILAESGMTLEVFRPLRLRFLETMLTRHRIFHTAGFRELEKLARCNMSRERAELTKHGRK
ncbi:MAG: metal-dependent phosphohydrolase [Planctomycetes bacterium]|nr:metal-dependent phosphohydrolase [Planctomycetota bacterium]